MSGNDAKQRLLAIRVGEVSLVDNAANEREFLVVKAIDDSGAKGDAAMAMLETLIQKHNLDAESANKLRGVIKSRFIEGKMTTNTKTEPVNKAEMVGLDPYTAMNVTLQSVRDRIWAVSDKLREGENLSQATSLVEEIKTMLDSAQQLATQVTKSIADFTGENGLGGVVAAIQKGDGKGKGKMPDWMKEQMKLLKAFAEKALAEDADEAEAAKAANAIEIVDGVMVVKGKAQFSKERVGKLKEALGALVGMAKDADPDGYAAWHASFAPATTAPAAGGEVAKSTPVTPDLASITKSLDCINAGLAGLVNRVEAVEKSNATPKGPSEGDGTQQIQKGNGSFWKGVL